MRTLTLTLPLPVNLANSRMHWRTKSRAHQEWENHAIATERQLRVRPVPMQRATASAVLYVGRWVMDDDNATARVKWCLDLAKRQGLILDDKRPHLTLLGIPEQRPEMPRRIELTLTEVGP